MCENKPAPAAPNDQVYQKLIVPPEKRQPMVFLMELLKPPFKPLNTSKPEFQGTSEVPGSPRLQPPLGTRKNALGSGRFSLWGFLAAEPLGRVFPHSCAWESLPTPSSHCKAMGVIENRGELSPPWLRLVWVRTGLCPFSSHLLSTLHSASPVRVTHLCTAFHHHPPFALCLQKA